MPYPAPAGQAAANDKHRQERADPAAKTQRGARRRPAGKDRDVVPGQASRIAPMEAFTTFISARPSTRFRLPFA